MTATNVAHPRFAVAYGSAGNDAAAPSHQRTRWLDRLRGKAGSYWPDLGPNPAVRFARRFRVRAGARLLMGIAGAGDRQHAFILKWFPDASDDDVALTGQRVACWQRMHPDLSDRVARIVACWPSERVIVMDAYDGVPLGRRLSARFAWPGSPAANDVDRLAPVLGHWLRKFADGRTTYGPEIEPLLGRQTSLRPDGRLVVDARCHLERRIELADRAAHALHRAGVRRASTWRDRLDVDVILRATPTDAGAGFVHGDLKPDNVLVSPAAFTLIDWWTTPRASWPLTDVATLNANLRFDATTSAAMRWWRRFSDAYFQGHCDEQTDKTIALLATAVCVTCAADRVTNGTGGARLARWFRRKTIAEGLAGRWADWDGV